MPTTETDLPNLGAALRVWLRIGLLSFGGPAGHIALLHREIVEQRGWSGGSAVPVGVELLRC